MSLLPIQNSKVNGLLSPGWMSNIAIDPRTQMAIGLLQGASPGGTFASGLSAGLSNVMRGQQFATQQKLMKLKMDEIQRQQKERERQQSLWNNYIGQQGEFSSPAMGSQAEFEAFDKPNYIPDVGGGLLMDKAPSGMYAQNPQMAETLGLLGPEKGADFVSQLALQNMEPQNPKDYLMNVDGNIYDTRSGQWMSPPGGGIGQPEFKDVLSLRKEAQKDLGEVAGAVASVRKLDALLTEAPDNSTNPMKDYAAMISFIKTLDPTSVVREGEVGMAQGAFSMWERLGLMAQKVEEGGFLTPKIRRDMKEAANGLLKEYEKIYKARRENMENMANYYRMPVDQVVGASPDFTPIQTSQGPIISPQAEDMIIEEAIRRGQRVPGIYETTEPMPINRSQTGLLR